MKIPKHIPSQDIDIEVEKIVIDPDDRNARVIMKESGRRTEKSIGLMSIYNQGTATQKQTIKVFIRSIVSRALGVPLSDVPDDIFN